MRRRRRPLDVDVQLDLGHRPHVGVGRDDRHCVPVEQQRGDPVGDGVELRAALHLGRAGPRQVDGHDVDDPAPGAAT